MKEDMEDDVEFVRVGLEGYQIESEYTSFSATAEQNIKVSLTVYVS